MKKIINKKFIVNFIVLVILVLLAFVKMPYLVYFPGGIYEVTDRYELENKNELKGSINITYVNEVHPNLPYLIYAYIRGYEIVSIKDLEKEQEEDLKTTQFVDRLLYEESIDNAVYVAYTNAEKNINISNLEYYIYFKDEDSNNKLKPGDKLISINDVLITSKDSISEIINSDPDEVVTVKFLRNKKEYEEDIEVVIIDSKKYLGVYLINLFDYKTNPKIIYNLENNVSGPSGGAMMSLSIYCHLIDEDLTHGLKIAGTGTIDKEGNIGPVGGIDYKLKSADKAKADIFFVPSYINYDEALKVKKDNNLDIEIVSISTFDEMIEFLKNYK